MSNEYTSMDEVRAGRPSKEDTVEEFGDLAPTVELLGDLAEAAAALTFHLKDGKLDEAFLARTEEEQTRLGIVVSVGLVAVNAHARGIAGYVAELFESSQRDRDSDALIS